MFKLSFVIFFTICCTITHAQPRPGQHVITCITVVDDKGKPVVIDESSIQLFPRLSVYNSSPGRDLSTTYSKNEEKGRIEFEEWAGMTDMVHPPFSKDQFLLSGPAREFVITRCMENSCEEMRIILLNNKSRTDSSRTTVYIIDNIVFRPGTYEIDCSKINSVKNAAYDSILNLRLYAVKTKLKPRENIYLPAKAFHNYYIGGYSFPGNNRFNFMSSGCSNITTVGNGVYELSGSEVKFIYTKPEGRIKPVVEVKQNNIIGDQYSIACRIMNERGEPLPGATLMIKGSNRAAMANNDGDVTWKINAGDHINGMVLQVRFTGYQSKEVFLSTPGYYTIKCIMDNSWLYYQDSGHVEHGIFTDYTDDYIGIYWLQPGEKFSFNNHEQMNQRVLYYNKRIRQVGIVCPD